MPWGQRRQQSIAVLPINRRHTSSLGARLPEWQFSHIAHLQHANGFRASVWPFEDQDVERRRLPQAVLLSLTAASGPLSPFEPTITFIWRSTVHLSIINTLHQSQFPDPEFRRFKAALVVVDPSENGLSHSPVPDRAGGLVHYVVAVVD